MNFKQAFRRVLFREVDVKLDYQEKHIELLLKNLKLCDKEQELHSKILMSYMESFQSLKSEQGLTTPFIENPVVKYNV
jgi:hypothetical protein